MNFFFFQNAEDQNNTATENFQWLVLFFFLWDNILAIGFRMQIIQLD